MNAALKAKCANHPLAQAILKEGLAIQDRFAAEPVYSKTGKGYLKSVGGRKSKMQNAIPKTDQ